MDESALLDTLTRVVTTLDASGVDFAVGGGCAVYARGGPPSEHDVDVFVREDQVRAAQAALVAEGMTAVEPPEDWLTKVYDGDVLVDLIFRPNHRPDIAGVLARAEMLRVGPVRTPVIAATDIMVDKLLVLGAHQCDFTPVLLIARELREQVDWERLATETAHWPYAKAFLVLLEELAVVERERSAT